jgi:TolB protein
MPKFGRSSTVENQKLSYEGPYSARTSVLAVLASRTAAAPLEDDDEIYVFDLESGEVTPLTRDDGPDHSPVWSPDGGRLAYVSVEGDRDCLRVISPGSGEEFVVVCSDRALGYPRWRPGTAQGSRGSKR